MAEIYIISTTESDKQYIGKTNRSSEMRFKEHLSDSLNKTREHRPLYAAMRKYGSETFPYQVLLEGLTPQEAESLEIDMINKCGTFNNGYNATVGGDGNTYRLISEEDVAFLVDLYITERMTIDDIAREVGADSQTVTNRLKEAGLEIPIRGLSFITLPVTMINQEGSEILFKTGNDCIDFIIDKKLTSTTRRNSISYGIQRVLKGERKSYLKHTFR